MTGLQRAYPFVTLPAALVVLRGAVALFFMAHAAVRIADGSIPRLVGFLESQGLPFDVALVRALSACELIAGTLMAAGWRARWMAGGLFVIAAMGIVLIHRHAGWFVGEHGTGGSEYSVSLMVSLLVSLLPITTAQSRSDTGGDLALRQNRRLDARARSASPASAAVSDSGISVRLKTKLSSGGDVGVAVRARCVMRSPNCFAQAQQTQHRPS